MDTKDFKESDLRKIVAEAAKELQGILPTLAKAEKAEDDKKEKDKKDDKEPKEEAKELEKDDSEAAAPVAPAEDAAPAAPEVEAKEPEMAEEEHEDKGEDLHEIYSLMDDHDLKLHYAALKACILERAAAHHSEAAPVDESEGMDDQKESAEPDEVPDGEQAMKSEPEMAKSEDFSALQAKFDELTKTVEKQLAKADTLEKSLDIVATFLEKALVKPTRKAVVSNDTLAKSETAIDMGNPQVVRSELTRLCARPDLAKHDRDLITDYLLGSKSVDAVKHLLIKS